MKTTAFLFYYNKLVLLYCLIIFIRKLKRMRKAFKKVIEYIKENDYNPSYLSPFAKTVRAVSQGVSNTKTVVDNCRDKGVAIRIGINSGSLPKDLQEQIAAGKISRAQGLCETAVREAEIFEKLNFDQYIVSMKSSDVQETIECNEFYAKKYNKIYKKEVTYFLQLLIC